ncbi:right-handed parallel beta-helix repeat-containing protein [Aristaeella hokkaidonensis]|uniref:Right-handed parallel beta-helix repeat-containing protein n=1 Tax=Aristaeella hokkaidonensis TaxID=3046382 RepID=A0AC61N9B5_9FIRM|nr:right-handed parallel beta-helix repeat-containing protein [Aristaeella hokkaidonensis]QUC67863.1 right-handed parallel beta-helix repeat-containing protein [Aristaeella hokkaidonensis]SNT92928.1 Right handed beta helix region [Aristaeella hokkaidonensis]
MLYYVNINAPREGDGSKERPFRFINEAAKIARPGDEVVVAPGVYREYVNPLYAGKEEARITYRSEKPLAAVITGAELLTGWKKVKGTTWTARVNNGIFGAYNPYVEKVEGDWYFSPIIRHTGAVFMNDLMMYECGSVEECEAGKPDPHAWTQEEAKYLWYTEQDGNETVLYANFHGKDPNKQKVEISVRRNCFMPDQTGIGYITVSGFTITKAATTWAPPAAYQDGMIGPHWSKGWIIEDCEVSNSRCCGISLGKYLDPENDMYFFHKKVKSPTQMERDAVCRGQYHGWLKEKVGSHIIRRCNVHHCEQTGIVGRMGGVFSTIEDCHIHHICNSQQLGGAETAGIKLHAAIDVTIRRNHIHNCIMGVWLDWEAQGARISQNLMHDNCRPEGREQARGAMFSTDIFIEVGHGPTLIDNNVLMSPVSITIPSEGIACVHNLVLGGFSLINSGVDSVVNGQREPRYTPYHIRHRTEVAGFMTILHGDDRIYNNLFIQAYPITDKERKPTDAEHQAVGTAPFDIFPTYEEWYAPFMPGSRPDMGALANVHFGHLPVWVDGNAYFNGASVCKHEKHKLSDKRSKVTIALEEKDGKYCLKTNVYSKLKDFADGIICTETLGKAFEPEQRFENPDGSDIVFDRDYFGNHRGTKTIPGPFASAEDAEKILY